MLMSSIDHAEPGSKAEAWRANGDSSWSSKLIPGVKIYQAAYAKWYLHILATTSTFIPFAFRQAMHDH